MVDSASIEVNRRHRRAKTDALDVRKLVEMLVRSAKGEGKVWRQVKIPSMQEEDKRRLHRERQSGSTTKESNRMRMRSLLKLHGIRPAITPGGRGWKEYLEGSKEILPEGLWQEVVRESARPDLVKGQIRDPEGTQNKEIAQSAETDEIIQKIFTLSMLRGIGAGSAWLLVMDKFAGSEFEQPKSGPERVSPEYGANNFSAGGTSRIGAKSRVVRVWTRPRMTSMPGLFGRCLPREKRIGWPKQRSIH